MGERQEHLSQFYEHHVVQKARVIVDDSRHVLAKSYEILPSGHVLKSNTDKSVQMSKQCSCLCVCACVECHVCKLRKLLLY